MPTQLEHRNRIIQNKIAEVMEIVARLLYALTVYGGWFFAPIYYLMSWWPSKKLPPITEPDIITLSATKLALKIRNKELSSERVVGVFIERCRQVNPFLNGIVEDRFEAALEEARIIDKALAKGDQTAEDLEKNTPLLGVPITVKESCSVGGMSFSVGAKLREGARAEIDGEAVKRIRAAGAIPMAVTNTPELCSSIETYNFITGYTCNPYDRHRSAGGSSGGEGVLIASGASILGIGSDFAGSIRVPCLFNGIFGHKPTPGIVSNAGHCPHYDNKEFQKLLTIGPMCRYAEDLRPTLKILAGENSYKLALDKPVNMRDLKIYYLLDKGFMLSEISVDSGIRSGIKAAVKHFEINYGCPVKKLNISEMKDLTEICVYSTAEIENLRSVFLLRKDQPESGVGIELLKSIITLSDYTLNVTVTRFIVETLLFLPKRKLFKYSALKSAIKKKLIECLGTDGVFFFPTFAVPAHYKHQLVWKLSSLSYCMLSNIMGLPSTHVPIGVNRNNLPIGFQVIAAPNQDRLCIAVAEELEKVFGGWVPPPTSNR